MKDRNSSNLSVELGDNQGAKEAAQALRDSGLVLSLCRHITETVAAWWGG